jgi:hypothetical protein
MSRVVKSVCFNLDDPMENEMYQHAMKFKGFSTFVKRLIQNSLNGKVEKIQPKFTIEQSHMEQVEIEQEFLKQLI